MAICIYVGWIINLARGLPYRADAVIGLIRPIPSCLRLWLDPRMVCLLLTSVFVFNMPKVFSGLAKEKASKSLEQAKLPTHPVAILQAISISFRSGC